MEQKLNDAFQCSICLSQFDPNEHIPLILKCGHNICPFSAQSIFLNNAIICPFCKQRNTYESPKNITINYALRTLIEKAKNLFETPQITITKSPFAQPLKEIDRLINNIKGENKKIEDYFNQLQEYKDKVLGHNSNLIKSLEIYKSEIKKKQKREFSVSWKDLSNVQNIINQDVKQIMDKISSTKDYYLTSESSLEKEITFKPQLDLEDLQTKIGELFDLELLSDYKSFSKNVLYNMHVHEEEDKNFIIKKKKNVEEIIQILKEEAEEGNIQALKIIAFLNLHGIEIEKNESTAKALFLRAAQLGDPAANYMCYCLKLQHPEQYLFSAILEGYHNSLTQIGEEIELNNFSLTGEIAKTISFLCYNKAAIKGSSRGKWCVGYSYHQGIGVARDYDKAAFYYQQAIDHGYIKTKEDLDSIYDLTNKFKQDHPDYQYHQGDYEELKNQKIVLF